VAKLNRFQQNYRRSTIGRSLQILSKADRRKIKAVALIQICMGVLDLLGVIAIGLLGTLAVTGIQSNQPNGRLRETLQILQLEDSTLEVQAFFLGLSAVLLLTSRTVLSIFFTRRTLFFLGRRGAKISSNLISRLLSQPLLVVQSRTTQETLYAVTRGVELLVLQVIATTVTLASDLSLLIILGVGLFIIDPPTALGSLLVFSLVGYFLYQFMHVRAGNLGIKGSELNIVSNEKIVEVFSSYRESVVRNRRDYYAREIEKFRFGLANVSAETYFLPYVSKYVIETAVILGAVLIGAAQFVLQDTTQAVATLSIFLAAGTRIAPAVLRLQQGSISIRSGLGQAHPTLALIEELGNGPLIENVEDKVDIIHEGFNSEISISNVTFTYPSKSIPAIDNISISIPPGTSIAFVGPSGAGKTTIIDVLLGVLNPDLGSVYISGLAPLMAVAKWPGAVSYVPQDVVISAGTIRENVALGFPANEATDELVLSALKVAHLEEFVLSLPLGLETKVGERGAMLSGGQRQRLGIARAMFTRPHLLVLDEATSSLDGETEASISEAIHELRGRTTVVLIAHRLSTIKNADTVVYLADGKMVAKGTFEEVRKAVPNFDRQATHLGL
jgi:ABC-type multidrug transport system fused ATPase/permease subunit